MLNLVNRIYLRDTFLLMKLNCLANTKTCFEFVQKEHQPNAIYCKMMKHERRTKYYATCNTIKCFSKLVKIAQFCLNAMAFYANVERFFPWCSHKPKRKRKFSGTASF